MLDKSQFTVMELGISADVRQISEEANVAAGNCGPVNPSALLSMNPC
jgi:hypothetical protein